MKFVKLCDIYTEWGFNLNPPSDIALVPFLPGAWEARAVPQTEGNFN